MLTWPEREFVGALYRRVLKRQPDPLGLDHHASRLGPAPDPQQAERLLDAFVQSQEARTVASKASLIGLLRKHLVEKDVPRGYVVSLGTHCYIGSFMKRWDLKKFSGPFDWLNSSIPMVTHCISDQFETFMDTRLHRRIPIQERLNAHLNFCDHSFYLEEYGVKNIFAHRDPKIDSEYKYLQRCIFRFSQILSSSSPKLFLCVLREEMYKSEDIARLAQILCEKTTNFKLIVFSIARKNPLILATRVSIKDRSKSYLVYKIEPLSSLGGAAFEDFFDELPLARIIYSPENFIASMSLDEAKAA